MFNRLNDTNSCCVIPAFFRRESTYTSTPGFLITTFRNDTTPPFFRRLDLYEEYGFI